MDRRRHRRGGVRRDRTDRGGRSHALARPVQRRPRRLPGRRPLPAHRRAVLRLLRARSRPVLRRARFRARRRSRERQCCRLAANVAGGLAAIYWFGLGLTGFFAAIAAGFCFYAVLLVCALMRVKVPYQPEVAAASLSRIKTMSKYPLEFSVHADASTDTTALHIPLERRRHHV